MRKLFKKKSSSFIVPSIDINQKRRKSSLQDIDIIEFKCRCKVDVKAKCFANLKEGEKVTVNGVEKGFFYIRYKGFVPQSALEINVHCYNIYLDLLPILKKDINKLKEIAVKYPKELTNLLLCDYELIPFLSILFVDELFNNHKKGLDSESFRDDNTPSIMICKEIIKKYMNELVKNKNEIANMIIRDEKVDNCLPPEISNMIFALYHSIIIENCNIPAFQLTCSFFCLRVLCPLFLDDIEYIKNIMKNTNIYLPLIKEIIKNPIKCAPLENCHLIDGKIIYEEMKRDLILDEIITLDESKIDKIKNSLFY